MRFADLPPERPGNAFVRWLEGTVFAHLGDAELPEGQEAEVMRTVRRSAALMGGVGALIAGRSAGPEGLRIFAEMCADIIAADPELLASLPATIEQADGSTRPVLVELHRQAAEIARQRGPE
jgi:hypothetical protein